LSVTVTEWVLAGMVECGDDPPPGDGWLPAHGVVVLGEVEPSHQAYGPLWSLAIRNS
jgi:hypothetical protein